MSDQDKIPDEAAPDNADTASEDAGSKPGTREIQPDPITASILSPLSEPETDYRRGGLEL